MVLLEAMIAVTVVGLAAVAVLGSYAATVRAGARARYALEAQALADERLARLSLLGREALVHLADSLARGRFASPFDGYRWSATSAEASGEPGLVDVRVTVEWDDGSYALPTRMWRPAGGLP